MKKILILSSAIMLAGASAGFADVPLGMGQPAYPVAPVPTYPAYVEPGPGYVVAPDWPSERYEHRRFRHNQYWAHRLHEREEREEREEHGRG